MRSLYRFLSPFLFSLSLFFCSVPLYAASNSASASNTSALNAPISAASEFSATQETEQIAQGMAYLNGDGVRKNITEGMWRLNQAAARGSLLAQYQLGQWFETQQQWEIALSWYQLAAPYYPEAERAYARLLEAQFNRQREKQLQLLTIEHQSTAHQPTTHRPTDHQQASATPTSPAASHTQMALKERINRDISHTLTSFDLSIGLLILLPCLGLLLWIAFRIGKRRAITSPRAHSLSHSTATLITQLNAQEAEIVKLKQQLHRLYQQLLKLQSAPPEAGASTSSSTTQHHDVDTITALAMFGFAPDESLNMPKIKRRYRQLSRIYHPDRHGSEHEMKRLNHALTLLQKAVRKSSSSHV